MRSTAFRSTSSHRKRPISSSSRSPRRPCRTCATVWWSGWKSANYPVADVDVVEHGDDLLEIVATLVSTAVNPKELEAGDDRSAAPARRSPCHLGSQHQGLRADFRPLTALPNGGADRNLASRQPLKWTQLAVRHDPERQETHFQEGFAARIRHVRGGAGDVRRFRWPRSRPAISAATGAGDASRCSRRPNPRRKEPPRRVEARRRASDHAGAGACAARMSRRRRMAPSRRCRRRRLKRSRRRSRKNNSSIMRPI